MQLIAFISQIVATVPEPVGVVVAAGLIGALVEVTRRALRFPSRFAGLVAAALGVLAGLVGAVEGGWLVGMIAGLTASGAYSSTKNAAQELQRDR